MFILHSIDHYIFDSQTATVHLYIRLLLPSQATAKQRKADRKSVTCIRIPYSQCSDLVCSHGIQTRKPNPTGWNEPIPCTKWKNPFTLFSRKHRPLNVVFVDVNAIVYILFAFISGNMLKVHAKHMPFFTWIHELMLFHHENRLQELEIWFDTAKNTFAIVEATKQIYWDSKSVKPFLFVSASPVQIKWLSR